MGNTSKIEAMFLFVRSLEESFPDWFNWEGIQTEISAAINGETAEAPAPKPTPSPSSSAQTPSEAPGQATPPPPPPKPAEEPKAELSRAALIAEASQKFLQQPQGSWRQVCCARFPSCDAGADKARAGGDQRHETLAALQAHR